MNIFIPQDEYIHTPLRIYLSPGVKVLKQTAQHKGEMWRRLAEDGGGGRHFKIARASQGYALSAIETEFIPNNIG